MQTTILSDVSTTTQSSATPTAAYTESVTIAIIITVAVILNIIAVVTIVTVIAHTRKTKQQLREICEDITRSRVDLTSQGGFRSNVDLAMMTSASAGDVRFINGVPVNSPSQQAFDYGGYCDLPEMDTGQSPGDEAQLVVSRNQPGRNNAPEELYAEITSSVNGRRSTLGNGANQLQLQQQQAQRGGVYADINHAPQQSLLQFNRHSLRGPDPIL